MTSRRYPSILKETIEEAAKWIREVTRTREEDVKNADQTRLKIDQLPQAFMISCSDETTPLVAANGIITFRVPFDFTLTLVKISTTVAPTGVTKLAVDINAAGVSIFSTVLTLDAGEKTSATAAVPAVISTFDLLNDTEMTVDLDAIGSTIAGAGLKIYLIGYKR